MLPSRRTFEADKQQQQQLQHLNGRMAQYLTRTQQLERENARLLAEIQQLRQARVAEREPRYKAEVRELRRTTQRVALEKSRAEMERQRLCGELETLRSLCGQQSDACRDVGGELQGRDKELRAARRDNALLQRRLAALQREYAFLEETHQQQMGQLRRQVDSQVNAHVVTESYRGVPAASMEGVQEYARGMSEGWIQTFEMYQQKVEEMERAIQEDQAMLGDLQREKMMHISELDKLRTDAEKQGQLQMRLEEQLLHMQEKFSRDMDEYQIIIDQLERERNAMAEAIGQRVQDHQHLLRVKMDMGMEVAAYRALLEGERVGLQGAHRRMNEHQRERLIDIKIPGQPYTPRTSTATRKRMDIRFTPSVSNMRRSPAASSGSSSPSRAIPISVASRAQHQSPVSRRDMVSFTKARAATSTTVPKDKEVVESERQSPKLQKTKTIKHVSQEETQTSSIKSSAATTSGIMLSPPRRNLNTKPEMESSMKGEDDPAIGKLHESESKDEGKSKSLTESSERKALNSVSVEEIIEKVIKPAGLEAKVCSSGESKITYHVEKTEQGDGSMKTQIVLQSKVEEEVDVSEDSALDQLLSQGVKKVSLEDIDDTETGSMIRNLLSGLQGEVTLQNKSVNVEIIEQPVESYDEEVNEKSRSCFNESTYFQIEEMEEDQGTQVEKSGDDAMKRSHSGSFQVQEESESLYFTQDQEPAEYFVSTPDDNLSEPEEGCGITSYGHYGMVDDLSDERYYQDDRLPKTGTVREENEYRFMSDRSFLKESIPECIIEEEIRVSPIVQESMLELLREDSCEPKEQLRGALEKLQDSVSGPLREELAFFTKVSSENPQNVAVDIKKVQHSSDSGTTTIVAELNVSQTLEDSGLLDDDNLSEEQIMAALSSSNLGSALEGRAGEGYSFRISKEQHVVLGKDLDFAREGESSSLVKLGPPERSFATAQEAHSSHTDSSSDQE
ncbi:synemin isoform X1 [Phyllopteryx taeniolatus]|uniref:synemin isoform X1 n=1 Tax=Phyllopteryx taeniolatus TaxID=161469 RepID=UPI002AD3DD56|nr:synemin isoform X1 [Phyllopteryx taeniolatus]